MDIRNCKNCGKMFNYINKPFCPTCEKMLEDKFVEVKAYIREHGTASIDEVAEENDVSVKQLRRWIREERLSFSEDSGVGIECENCGAMIRTGRFCEACKNMIGNNLSSAIHKPAPEPAAPKKKEGARMRFLDGK